MVLETSDQLWNSTTPKVGLTDYKDHMGTNLSPEVDKWVGTGEQRFPIFLSKYFDIVCMPNISES